MGSHLVVLGASVQGVGLDPFQAYAATAENTSNLSSHKGKQEHSKITSHLASTLTQEGAIQTNMSWPLQYFLEKYHKTSASSQAQCLKCLA